MTKMLKATLFVFISDIALLKNVTQTTPEDFFYGTKAKITVMAI